jgi:S1-C subfamily serine protease
MGRGRSSVAALRAAAALLLAGCAAPDAGSPAAREPEAGLEAAVELQDAFARVAETVFPSVVCLTSYVTDPAPPPAAEGDEASWREATRADRRYPGKRRLASASGFALADDGYLISCLRFLQKPGGGLADLVDAETPDGRVSLCRIVGAEPTLDVAVLRIEVYPEGRAPVLAPVVLADAGSVRPGQWAIAVGDPLGPERTFTAGIIAARPQRDCYQADLTATFLQASLAINPEAWGGPLVNIRGEVLGLLVPPAVERIDAPPGGVVHALPMTIATGIFESLKTANSFRSPWLGFSVLGMAELRARQKAQRLPADPRQPLMGVYIDDVFDPSPAASAGIQVGDILLKVNGQRLISVFHFQTTLYVEGIGSALDLELYRDGETFRRTVTIEGRPPEADAG